MVTYGLWYDLWILCSHLFRLREENTLSVISTLFLFAHMFVYNVKVHFSYVNFLISSIREGTTEVRTVGGSGRYTNRWVSERFETREHKNTSEVMYPY